MKKLFLLITGLFLPTCLHAQVVVQTWIDPCTSAVQTAAFPLNGAVVAVMYRDKIKTFTAQQAAAGELMIWVNQITATTPCPITNNPVNYNLIQKNTIQTKINMKKMVFI